MIFDSSDHITIQQCAKICFPLSQLTVHLLLTLIKQRLLIQPRHWERVLFSFAYLTTDTVWDFFFSIWLVLVLRLHLEAVVLAEDSSLSSTMTRESH